MKTFRLIKSVNGGEYSTPILIKGNSIKCFWTDLNSKDYLETYGEKFDGDSVEVDGVTILFHGPFDFMGEE
jgi:hypothetical protein